MNTPLARHPLPTRDSGLKLSTVHDAHRAAPKLRRKTLLDIGIVSRPEGMLSGLLRMFFELMPAKVKRTAEDVLRT